MPQTSHATTDDSVTVRPASCEDITVIASLLVQLYDAELPGALVGSFVKRQALLRFTLEVNPEVSLRHRYVMWLGTGKVIATGMMQLPGEPVFERAPAGTLQQARSLLGRRGATRLLFTVARSVVGVHQHKDADAVMFHSVVVHKDHRGSGLGKLLVRELERNAIADGYHKAIVQVLAANKPAHRLYGHIGYQEVWQTPHWLGAFTWPSLVMAKPLGEVTDKQQAHEAAQADF